MNDLESLIEAVKEEGLTKTQLESYHTSITYLDNLFRLEIAPIEKEEALFFSRNKEVWKVVGPAPLFDRLRTDIEIKRMWKATEEGQRQIELSHYLKVTPKLLQSIKTRLYGMPY